MPIQAAIVPLYVHVRNDYEVVALRQQVRETARVLGLGLAAQAKLSAAISTIARGVLSRKQEATFTVRAAGTGHSSSIEVTCTTPLAGYDDVSALVASLGIDDLRMLLDEIYEAQSGDSAVLTLRMRLVRLA